MYLGDVNWCKIACAANTHPGNNTADIYKIQASRLIGTKHHTRANDEHQGSNEESTLSA